MAGPTLTPADFRALCGVLHQWTGIHLGDNKRHLVVNRLTRRVADLGMSRYQDYLQLLVGAGPESGEGRIFINSLTTNKTSFFREPRHFDYLRDKLVPELRRRAATSGSRSVRVWSAAASTGEEPYTIALVLRQALPAAEGWDVKILATDLDTDVLDQARSGVYEASRLEAIPDALVRRYFERLPDRPDHHRLSPEIAGMVTFVRANLVAEPFPVRGRFDVIFCRNVMIYFDRPTQIRLVTNLLARLAPGACLIVGHSESLIGFPTPLETLQVGVYRPVAGVTIQPAPASVHVRGAIHSERRLPSGRAVPAFAPGRRAAIDPKMPRERIVLGQWTARRKPSLVGTLLGSCVSACLYDPVSRVGGINHFMLPGGDAEPDRPARFGVHAMEMLINEMMALGADRRRLVAKVFGAAAVTKVLSPRVAEENATFIRQFLARDSIRIVAERLGGERPHDILMRTDTGDVFHRLVKTTNADALARIELEARKRLENPALVFTPPAEPELF